MFFFSCRRRHTRLTCDWSSDVLLFRSARAARGHAGQRVLEDDGLLLGHAEVGGRGEERVGGGLAGQAALRSEERRVGKGCLSRGPWGPVIREGQMGGPCLLSSVMGCIL